MVLLENFFPKPADRRAFGAITMINPARKGTSDSMNVPLECSTVCYACLLRRNPGKQLVMLPHLVSHKRVTVPLIGQNVFLRGRRLSSHDVPAHVTPC